GPRGTRLPFPCGRPKGPTDTIMKAGESVKWSLAGGATHNGGHCEISLSYDDKTFVSIQTIIGNCMKKGKLDYEVTIPANAPSGNATFAWTWVNWEGNREYYMNCADVIIEGSPNGVLTGPKMVEANMPGRPTIPEFYNNARTSAELYENRPNVSVTGSGVTGPVAPQPQPQPTTTAPSKPEPTGEEFPTEEEFPTSEEQEVYPPVNKPSVTKPSYKPSVNKPQPNYEPARPYRPEPTQGNKPEKCQHGKWECNGEDYRVCVWGVWEERRCSEDTKCYQATPFNILCL
ncbi:hypothetical protein CONCODRAFT_10657, partial [Conidiobolus coronatus NRRL 28638]